MRKTLVPILLLALMLLASLPVHVRAVELPSAGAQTYIQANGPTAPIPMREIAAVICAEYVLSARQAERHIRERG